MRPCLHRDLRRVLSTKTRRIASPSWQRSAGDYPIPEPSRHSPAAWTLRVLTPSPGTMLIAQDYTERIVQNPCSATRDTNINGCPQAASEKTVRFSNQFSPESRRPGPCRPIPRVVGALRGASENVSRIAEPAWPWHANEAEPRRPPAIPKTVVSQHVPGIKTAFRRVFGTGTDATWLLISPAQRNFPKSAVPPSVVNTSARYGECSVTRCAPLSM